MDNVGGIIVAAGRGERVGSPLNKVYLPLGDSPVLLHSVRLFERSSLISTYVVVAAQGEISFCKTLLASCRPAKLAGVVSGGATRQESVSHGVRALPADCTLVVVHDGARPLLSLSVLEGAVRHACSCGAVVVGVPVKDTIKVVDQDVVKTTPDRSSLWIAQTPQIFRRSLLCEALEMSASCSFQGTDDSSLVERLGVPVEIYRGEYENIKITTPEDLVIAETIMAGADGSCELKSQPSGVIRTGIGYDVHPFCDGRLLVLGGIEIPGEVGLDGHSDADVVLHALIDACLGAAGLPDLGHYFPPSDPQWKNASSLALLAIVNCLLNEEGYSVENVDLVIAAERPRLSPYLQGMRDLIAVVLNLSPGAVGLKATTSEGLGFVGREEGIAAWAVATITSKEKGKPLSI